MNPAMRRNLLLLAVCQALGQSANTMMFAATALSVATFIGAHNLATLPITMQHLGVMLSVFPAALLMQRRGRSFGFRLGSTIGMIGAATCGAGLILAGSLHHARDIAQIDRIAVRRANRDRR